MESGLDGSTRKLADGLSDPQAEMATIGGMLFEPETVDHALAIASPEMFMDPSAKLAAEVISEIFTGSKNPVDLVSVAEGCRHRKMEGALQFISQCESLAIYPGVSISNARRVRDLYNRRQVVNLSANAITRAQDLTIKIESVISQALAESRACLPEWSDPRPLTARDLPEFPVDCYPDWLRDFVLATAEEMQVPVDLPAMLALGTISAAIARKVQVSPTPGWCEPTNLWTLVVLPPGNRKSPVHNRVTAPLYQYEKDAVKKADPEGVKVKLQVLTARQKAALKAAVEGDTHAEAEACRLGIEIAELQSKRPERILASDSTIAKLGMILEENNARIAVASDEAYNFFEKICSDGAQGDLDHVLKWHSGNHDLIDRVGRPSVSLHAPALSLILAGQPGVLELIRQHEARGLSARILCSLPPSLVGTRSTKSYRTHESVTENYGKMIQLIAGTPWNTSDIGELRWNNIRLSPDAVAIHTEFAEWIEPRLAADGKEDLFGLVEWGSKLLGHTLRIAGCLHAAANPHAVTVGQIAGRTYHAARSIAEYLIPHASAMHERMMDSGEVARACRDILNWIRANGELHFKQRMVQTVLRDRHKDHFYPALNRLVHLGYIRITSRKDEEGTQAGRPTNYVSVNPIWMGAGE